MDESGVYKRDEGDRPVEHSPRGRYIRFDIKLGTGAYKTVYKAYDTDQGIDVAWNAIDIGVLPSAEKTRIIQEVQLLQKLEHKNIINFYGSWFSKEKNQVVFITEIMTSGTLKSYIKRVQFVKWKIIKRWCIQILEGLHYLHSQNPPVIHRDLKCDNIFINGNTGDLRIGDLGLSTQLAVHKKSRAQSVLGTPEFMAPELYDESYDEKVDIYAFGMCVLEMVTKEVPYSECINPAQIYKKVTAGIRPRGLQRIVSQAAKDFIELCLSRGNGLIDVSAEYLLDHPFLKAQDDDGEMVRCLEEDELEREMKQEQKRLAHVSEESFAEELNMESCSKGSDQANMTDRRKMFPSLSLEPEELSSTSSTTSAAAGMRGVNPLGSSESRNDIPAEEKSAGKHRMVDLPPTHPPADQVVRQQPQHQALAAAPLPPSAPPVAATSALAAAPANAPEVDGPLSGKKDVDHNVNQFLATMPGSETKIQNNRMNVMGGRGHRLELEKAEEYSEDEAGQSPSATADGEIKQHEGASAQESAADREGAASALAELVAVPMNPASAAQPTPVPQPVIQRVTSEVDYSHLRRPSFQAQGDPPIPPVHLEQPNSRPLSASSNTSNTNVAPRKRGRRHEIRAEKDPENEHSIMLYLRLTIDGKSKEIKFPFNLFSDSTHDVACELALDVGILEPDLEEIADSISFLVTEGKINNLPDVSEDVWEEAPEPHSISSKPLPHVSKMSFVSVPGMPSMQLQQAPAHLLSPAPTGLDRSLNGPAYSLGDLGQAESSSSNPPAVSLDGPASSSMSQPQAAVGVPAQVIPAASNATGMVPKEVPAADPLASSLREGLQGFYPEGSATSVGSTASYASSDVHRTPPAPLVHASSDINLSTEDLYPKQAEWERGVSVGSVSDPNFVRKVLGMEDRLKIARSAFDERDSNLVAAMREVEERHQREIERFRQHMEELSKQRAAIANNDHTGDESPLEVDLGQVNIDESMNLGYNGGMVMSAHGVEGMDSLFDRIPAHTEMSGFPDGPSLLRNTSFDTRRQDVSVSAPTNGVAIQANQGLPIDNNLVNGGAPAFVPPAVAPPPPAPPIDSSTRSE